MIIKVKHNITEIVIDDNKNIESIKYSVSEITEIIKIITIEIQNLKK